MNKVQYAKSVRKKEKKQKFHTYLFWSSITFEIALSLCAVVAVIFLICWAVNPQRLVGDASPDSIPSIKVQLITATIASILSFALLLLTLFKQIRDFLRDQEERARFLAEKTKDILQNYFIDIQAEADFVSETISTALFWVYSSKQLSSSDRNKKLFYQAPQNEMNSYFSSIFTRSAFEDALFSVVCALYRSVSKSMTNEQIQICQKFSSNQASPQNASQPSSFSFLEKQSILLFLGNSYCHVINSYENIGVVFVNGLIDKKLFGAESYSYLKRFLYATCAYTTLFQSYEDTPFLGYMMMELDGFDSPTDSR